MKLPTEEEYERQTLAMALSQDKNAADAGMEALRLFVSGCDSGKLSAALLRYMADRIAEITHDGKPPEEALRLHSGSRRRGREYHPVEVAAAYFLLLKRGWTPERAKEALQEQVFNKKPAGIDRRLIERTAKSHAPMATFDRDLLLHMTGSVRKKVTKLIP